jgi:hypothetical protein
VAISLKQVIFIVLFLLATYFTLTKIAMSQTIEIYHDCDQELNFRQRLLNVKSDNDFRMVALELKNCINENMTFPASLFFDKEEFIASTKLTQNQ